jgi:hypothetical protein
MPAKGKQIFFLVLASLCIVLVLFIAVFLIDFHSYIAVSLSSGE